MIIDTHTHYDDKAYDEDRDETLLSLREGGVSHIINVSSSLATLVTTIELARRYDFVYAAAGVHPDEVGVLNDDSFEDIRSAAHSDKVVAIGEIGLDYYWDTQPRELQKKWFVRQMNLARELGLPMIFHSRDAAEDTMEIIREAYASGKIAGVMHCYSYSVEQAREYLNMGLYLGIGGVITFKNARKLCEVTKEAPLERLLLETDCPYLSPDPYRGKRNSSHNLTFVAAKIAELKGITAEEVIAATRENARRLFRMG